MSAKVFVFGIDAMDEHLISKWIDEGALPAFASLKERGAWTNNVISPPRRFSGASWPNVYTGVGPKSHNQYVRTVFSEEDYSWHGVRPSEDNAPPFWLQDGWGQKQIAIINVPYAPLGRQLNEMQVINWGVHDSHSTRMQTWPKELGKDILLEFGPDPVGLCDIDERTLEDFCNFRDQLIARVNAKRDMFCKYLDAKEWDLFFCVLDEPHCVGHACWHLLDTNNPLNDPETARIVGNPIKDVYKAIDNALATVLDHIDDHTTMIVLASHGMGPTQPESDVMDEVLRRIEGRATGTSTKGISSVTKGISSVRKSIGRLPVWTQKLLQPLREKYSWHLNESMRKRERRDRRYFTLETQDATTGIRINLKGRESQGLVMPGEDYEGVITYLTNELLALVDGETGEPMVERVTRREDIDYSELDGSIPDLVIEWAEKYPASIESPAIGRVDPLYFCRTGNHAHMAGFLAAVGPTVASGQVTDPVYLEDLAPTIAKLLDVPIGVAEGRPINQLLSDERQNDSQAI